METNKILSILDAYMHESAEGVARKIANDFRKRRIEKILHANRWLKCQRLL